MFGLGCFWGAERMFWQQAGVYSTSVGYAAGMTPNPTYEEVCSGMTGHAEVVRVEYDPQRISLREVLEIFFTIHDPTTRNRQGNDIGPQYRSGIYYTSSAQQAVAREVIDEVNAHLKGRVVTELLPLDNYARAEAYHQHYFVRNPGQGYCAFVVAPKVEKFKRTFASRMRKG